MSDQTVSILDGDTFVVSDRRGDIEASPTEPHGLFRMDTRFLSRWVLTLDGKRPGTLSTDDLDYFAAQFFLVPSTGTIYVDSHLSVVRKRAVGGGFHEDLTVFNHSNGPVDITVRIEAAADFADLFEVKDALAKKGAVYSRVEDGRLVLGYRRERFIRETWVSATADCHIDEGGLQFQAHIQPHGEWTTCLDVVTARDGLDEVHTEAKYRHRDEAPKPNIGMTMDELLARTPQLASSWAPLERTYRRSLIDLAALRFFPRLAMGHALPAAGLPWFMAVFGRDSIITSFQALPFAPPLARTTLEVLGARQGTTIDDFRDEEPGKILHEVRWGELTAFEERPHSPYFGAADATPLFLVLLDEYERWTGDVEFVRRLEPEARSALRWIDEYGDRDGDGYVEYDRRNKETGLENQCWKDSWDSIRFADGRLAPLPRATCEIQGYVYDAKRRTARLARQVWGDPALADKLEQEAAELKRRFNRDFWVEDREFFAIALDGEKRKADSLTSNIGHLLWSGIADEDKAAACVRHLMGDKLFSGWGVRTMAVGEGPYNPIGYHVGTVWPHDNSIIALGLRRYGYREEAARVALGILEAANFFNHRLPEAFAGYPREQTRFPVEYPTACSPQAWSTGAPLLLLRVLLGLEPVGDRLLVDPAIPTEIGRLELLGIPGRWGLTDAFGRGLIALASREAVRVSA
jgi:glycogen debranching enzyme